MTGRPRGRGPMTGKPRTLRLIGRRFGDLAVTGRSSNRQWIVECDCGRQALAFEQNLLNGSARSCGDHPAAAGTPAEVRAYARAHRRVVHARGAAREHTCARGDHPAEEWGFNHHAHGMILYTSAGFPYSDDPADYLPLCRSCHRRADGHAAADRRAIAFGAIPFEL